MDSSGNRCRVDIMSVIQYEKHKCDNCGKEIETKYGGHPKNWFEISVTKWDSPNSGLNLIDKEMCSDKCVLEYLKQLKSVPKKRRIIEI